MLSPFSSRHFRDVVVVDFHAEALDETHAYHLAEDLLDLLHQSNARRLYLNFTKVRSVADPVWLELIDLNTYLQEAGWHLCLTNLPRSLSRRLHRIEQPEPVAAQ